MARFPGTLAPAIAEILDRDIVYTYTYDYTLIVDSLEEIREHVYESEANRTLPRWEFTEDRQHWIYKNTVDEGWPIEEGLRFNLRSRMTRRQGAGVASVHLRGAATPAGLGAGCVEENFKNSAGS